MLESKCLFMCFCYMIIGSFATSVPFIDKCEWQNQACLTASSQKALPYFVDGLPDLGVPPMDPMYFDKIVLDQGGLKITFTGVTVTGAKKCKVLNVERDGKHLSIEAECPIVVRGTWKGSGKLLSLPLEGEGPCLVKTERLFVSVKVGLSYVDGADGHKHWKIGKSEETFEVLDNPVLQFDNLFYGDESKAGTIKAFLKENGKPVVQSVGGCIVHELIQKVIDNFKKIAVRVKAEELEL